MSTLVDLLPSIREDSFDSDAVVFPPESLVQEQPEWDPSRFAQEQLRSLIQRIFLAPAEKSARQVVFSRVEQGTETSSVPRRVAELLANESSRPTCLVQMNDGDNDFPRDLDGSQSRFGRSRESCRQLGENLWLMTAADFGYELRHSFSTAWLRGRLAELRLEFECTLFEAPPIAFNAHSALLGSLCDGVILMVQENSTRRSATLAAKRKLESANARLLGAILTERRFPIPQALYRRL